MYRIPVNQSLPRRFFPVRHAPSDQGRCSQRVHAGPGDNNNKGSGPSNSPQDDDAVPDYTGSRAKEFDPAGNRSLQEELVEVLSLEVKKESINETTRQEEQKLRDTADQAKMEIDLFGLELQARTDAAFDSAMAKIDAMADEMEEELRRSRAQIEKDQQAVDEFEQLAVQRQNEGQFFKGLYQASKPARKGRDSLSVSGMAENDMTAGQRILADLEREEADRREREAEERAKEQLRSPVRAGYYGFLMVVLVGVIGIELVDPPNAEPSYFHIGLYGSIAGVLALQLSREMKLMRDKEGGEDAPLQ